MNALPIRTFVVSMTIFAATAQTSSFDVATLKLRKGMITSSHDPFIKGRTVDAAAVTLRDLLTYAYNVRYEQLAGGPHWSADDHYDHVHEPRTMTPVALFLLFSADPCVAVIPILFAAAPLGVWQTLLVVGAQLMFGSFFISVVSGDARG